MASRNLSHIRILVSHATSNSTIANDSSVYSTVLLDSFQPREYLRVALLKQQIFQNFCRFRDMIVLLKRLFVNNGLSAWREFRPYCTFCFKPLCHLLP